MQKTFVADAPGLDPTLPDVVLRIGGVDRHLCFDFNAIAHAEKQTGLNLLRSVASDITAESLRGLLWAALLKESPKLTLDEAGAMVTPSNIGTIHAAILAAWFGSVGADDDKNEPIDPKPEAQADPAMA